MSINYMTKVAFIAEKTNKPFVKVRAYGKDKVDKIFDEIKGWTEEVQPQTTTETAPVVTAKKNRKLNREELKMIKEISLIRDEIQEKFNEPEEYEKLGQYFMKKQKPDYVRAKYEEVKAIKQEFDEKIHIVEDIAHELDGINPLSKKRVFVSSKQDLIETLDALKNGRNDAPKVKEYQNFTSEATLASRNYTYKNINEKLELFKSPLVFFNSIKKQFVDILFNETRTKNIKFNLSCVIDFDVAEDYITKKLSNNENYPKMINKGTEYSKIEELYINANEAMNDMVLGTNEAGTDATINAIKSGQLQVSEMNSISGASYFEDKRIKDKKCILNIRNEDNYCFLYCIAAFLNPVEKNKTRASNYDISRFNIQNISFPMEKSNISKFEEMNKEILSNRGINIYYLEGERIDILRPAENPEEAIDLLYLKNETTAHFCLITNFNAACNLGKPEIKNKYFACKRCLTTTIRDKKKFDEHLVHCQKSNACRLTLPENNEKYLFFKNHNRKLKVPFSIYYDFECTLEKVDDKKYMRNGNLENTQILNSHKPNSFACYTKCIDGKHDKLYCSDIYEDSAKCVEDFVKYLIQEERRIHSIKKTIIPMNLSAEEEEQFKNAKNCHICGKKYKEKDITHRDHCHITGEYRGSACAGCNLKYSFKPFIPCLAHNSKGYDSHLIIKEIAKQSSAEFELTCIASSSEKYISFSRKQKRATVKNTQQKRELYEELRFIDSNSFLQSSLSAVAETMNKEDFNLLKANISTFSNTRNNINNENYKEYFNALIKKGIYPYEYIDSVEKFNDRILPPKYAFSSSLYGGKIDNEQITEEISDKDYKTAQDVWELFKCENLKEYHMIYLKTDVLLLSDIFEFFRESMISKYKLDPLYSYTLPGYSWEACLSLGNKFIDNVCFELLTDPNMFNMIDNNMRGGISMVKHRYMKSGANTENEDKKRDRIYYIDANNLYGWAMSQYLPIRNFKFVDEELFPLFTTVESIQDINKFNNNEERTGYIFDVDLFIPDDKHDYFAEYPPLPQHFAPSEEYLSEWQKTENKQMNNGKVKCSKVKKLCLTLEPKQNYVIHYKLLQLYLSLGVKISKINNIISFTEKQYLKSYIEKNTEYRSKANSDFEKNLFKLLNNSLFGKTMENVRNRVNFMLVTDREKHRKLISKPNYQETIRFDDNLAGVHMTKSEVKATKPIYCGFSILDLSKCLMYDFFYNTLKKNFPDVKLCMTDTDSFIYSINCTNKEYDEFMKNNLDKFDTSNFPKDHKYFSKKNNKVIGKFKFETEDKEISEFCGLGSKQYSYKIEGEDISKIHSVNKGTKKCLNRNLNIEKYKQVLFTKKSLFVTQQTFKTNKHEVSTISQNKLSLNCYDDKNYILDDGISTLPYGHYSIRKTAPPSLEELTIKRINQETENKNIVITKYDKIKNINGEILDILYNGNENIEKIIKESQIYPITTRICTNRNYKNKDILVKDAKYSNSRFVLSEVNFIKNIQKSKLTKCSFSEDWMLKGYLKSKNATLHENFNYQVSPYFDFEIKFNPKNINVEDVKFAYACMYNNVVNRYIEDIKKLYELEINNEDIKIYSFDASDYISESEYKISFHFIIKNFINSNSPIGIYRTMPAFINDIQGFDNGAYKSNQNMRFAFSVKDDGSRPLKRFIIKNNEIKYISIDDIQKLKEELSDYIISNIKGSKYDLFYTPAVNFGYTEKKNKDFYLDDEEDDDMEEQGFIGENSSSTDSDSETSDDEEINNRLTEEKLKSILENIDPDLEYKEWYSIICGIYNVCIENKLNYEKMATYYSMRGAKYDSKTLTYIKSIERNKKNNVTIGTLYYFMKNNKRYIKGSDIEIKKKANTMEQINDEIMNMTFKPLF